MYPGFTALLMVFALALPSLAGRRHPAYREMLEAARMMQRASSAILEFKIENEILDDSLDVNRTGYIGVEFSSITSTVGTLSAKRTSANPDFAAYIVRELIDHGLSSDDSILVAMTGSFPALNIAVLCAAEVLEIPLVTMASLAASSYGANQEECTWLDIENLLVDREIISHRSDVVTLGAAGDRGGGLPEDGKDLLRRRAHQLKYDLSEAPTSRSQLKLRKKLSGSSDTYALLINIGGNQTVVGKEGRVLPGGWIDPDEVAAELDSLESSSLMFEFLRSGIPVLNLLHVEDIAEKAGIPIDPIPLPPVGKSSLYSARDKP